MNNLAAENSAVRKLMDKSIMNSDRQIKWDVFISHASEDKAEVARPLAKMLKQKGLRVWLDEHELVLGDSIRQKIDEGLAKSSWGVVILSPSLLQKEWPQAELDAFVSREFNGQKVILPVWHRISAQDLLNNSPLLASRFGISTSKGLDAVCQAILRAVDQKQIVRSHHKNHFLARFLNSFRSSERSSNESQVASGAEAIQECWFTLSFGDLYFKLRSTPSFFSDQAIGQYILKDFIGVGGTGVVFRAFHRLLGKLVAFKLFFPLNNYYGNITRVTERAVRGLAFLRHRNIATLLDFGYLSSQHGETAYLVYELVDGEPLDEWSFAISKLPHAMARRLEMACKVATAVEASHDCKFVGNAGFQETGVMHGDIKPSNILVEANGEEPILLDFMLPDIQKLMDEGQHRHRYSFWKKREDGSYCYDPPLTARFGTPDYMPPEQALDGIVTPSSDVFALGRTFSQLFWPSEHGLDHSLNLMLEAKKGNTNQLEQKVAQLIGEMIADQPSDRIQSMSIVVDRLKTIEKHSKNA